jgi:hypothetical protein
MVEILSIKPSIGEKSFIEITLKNIQMDVLLA